jgi:hypothetical protein
VHLGHIDGLIAAAVVDDQRFDRVYAVKVLGEVGERNWKRRLLIEARDLDDQFHLLLAYLHLAKFSSALPFLGNVCIARDHWTRGALN